MLIFSSGQEWMSNLGGSGAQIFGCWHQISVNKLHGVCLLHNNICVLQGSFKGRMISDASLKC